MTRTLIATAAALELLLVSPSRAQLASPPEQAPAALSSPSLGFDLSLSPRAWVTTEAGQSRTFLTPGLPAAAAVSTSLAYPMFGASATLTPHAMQTGPYPVDFTFTGIGGSGQSSQTVVTTSGLVQSRKLEQDRVDFEALGRISLSPTTKLVLGPRFFRVEDRVIFPVSLGTNVSPAGSRTVTIPEYFFVGELGVQLAAPITDDGVNTLFAGAVTGPGYGFTYSNLEPSRHSSFFLGFLDVNAGYQYSFNQTIAGYVRYRAQFAVPTNGGPFLERVAVKHGPEVALTIRF